MCAARLGQPEDRRPLPGREIRLPVDESEPQADGREGEAREGEVDRRDRQLDGLGIQRSGGGESGERPGVEGGILGELERAGSVRSRAGGCTSFNVLNPRSRQRLQTERDAPDVLRGVPPQEPALVRLRRPALRIEAGQEVRRRIGEAPVERAQRPQALAVDCQVGHDERAALFRKQLVDQGRRRGEERTLDEKIVGEVRLGRSGERMARLALDLVEGRRRSAEDQARGRGWRPSTASAAARRLRSAAAIRWRRPFQPRGEPGTEKGGVIGEASTDRGAAGRERQESREGS